MDVGVSSKLPVKWTKVGTEGDANVNAQVGNWVRYGQPGHWVYWKCDRTPFPATNVHFKADPLWGVLKVCEVLQKQ
jgi:hypothetical protein